MKNARLSSTEGWQSTACLLCSLNCGIEVQLEGRRIKRVRGDKSHPSSKGYLCQKAARLDYYQNHERRLDQPLRRQEDGSFAPIDWDTAIAEIAQKLVSLRDEHGGHSIAYYGGGGQGNHLPGAYASAFRAALETPYTYNSLAQEKTGDFWVNGELFGRQTCHITEGIEDADYVLLLGTNPWQSHGFPQARQVLKEISKDPSRTLVVVDPRRTKTADLADIHLQVKPGTDAFLMAAMLGTIVQEGLEDKVFLEAHAEGFATLQEQFMTVPVAAYAKRAGCDEGVVRQVARGLAGASVASTRHDLGLEHSLHSTLNCYLEKLLFLLTGNLGKAGSNNLHTQFIPLIGHSKHPERGGMKTKVTGMQEISKMYPPNVLPQEIDNEHPERVRAVFVDSSNPLQTAADTQAYRKAFEQLELLVVVDVAMTETAAMADYILPASTQLEKVEATFFTLSFPTNYFHLRKPVMPPEGNTLSEPEIYSRLLIAMGAIPAAFPELEEAAKAHMVSPESGHFPMLFQMTLMQEPSWKAYAPALLYLTLGKALPEGMAGAAVVWGATQFYAQRYPEQVRRAGYDGEGLMLAESLFRAIIESETAVPLSTHTYEEMWSLVRHPSGKVHLPIPAMLKEMAGLASETPLVDEAFPFVLSAGERRSYNANQIFQDAGWRKNDPTGALRINPQDALSLGFDDGIWVRCASRRGQVRVQIQLDDSVQPGCLSLPHGYGQQASSPDAPEETVGPYLNLLTDADHCDPTARTPYHKYIPVQLYREL